MRSIGHYCEASSEPTTDDFSEHEAGAHSRAYEQLPFVRSMLIRLGRKQRVVASHRPRENAPSYIQRRNPIERYRYQYPFDTYRYCTVLHLYSKPDSKHIEVIGGSRDALTRGRRSRGRKYHTSRRTCHLSCHELQAPASIKLTMAPWACRPSKPRLTTPVDPACQRVCVNVNVCPCVCVCVISTQTKPEHDQSDPQTEPAQTHNLTTNPTFRPIEHRHGDHPVHIEALTERRCSFAMFLIHTRRSLPMRTAMNEVPARQRIR